MKQYDIFISYRREGGEILAHILYERLREEGFSVFQDIESLKSGKFNEKLYDVIEQCTYMLLILPPNALERCDDAEDWVRKEIVHALSHKKTIIPIMLRGFIWPEGLPKDMEEIRYCNGLSANMEYFEQFVEKLKTFLVLPSDNDVKSELLPFSIDKELENKFDEIFGDMTEAENKSSKSLLIEKMEKIKSRNFVNKIMKPSLEGEVEKSSDSDLTEISEEQCIGKYFSLIDPPGIKTLIYIVRRNVSYKMLARYVTMEILETADEYLEGGSISRTYFAEGLDENGNPLVIIQFDTQNKEAYVNMGFLGTGNLQISTQPMTVSYQMVEDDEKLQLSNSLYKTEEISEKVIHKDNSSKQRWYVADIKSRTVVVDPDSGELVLRELYYDENENTWKAKIKLVPGKKYLAFQVRLHNAKSGFEELTPLEIGKFYRTGEYGFPKDFFKAAEYFEKDGSAEALYEIAVIFKEEPEVQNEEMYLEYIKRAAGEGAEKAQEELVQYNLR